MIRSLSDARERPADALVMPVRPMVLAFILAVLAYASAFHNGFISDDFVILGRVESWLKDFRTFSIPPEGIRLTLYGCFALLRSLFSFRPELFYGFAILLHLLNVWLVGKLLLVLTGRKSLAVTGAILFAVVQNPQEAVMWLSGMGDTLVGVFTLAALLAWTRERFLWCVVCYAGALLSKDSGLSLLVLVPLIDWLRIGRVQFRRQYLYLLLPTAGFLALFLATMQSNTYLSAGLYAFRPSGVLTILNSAHRLAFPWLYLALLLCLVERRYKWSRGAAAFLAWISITLMPYSFITYQNHVPSRSQYLAAMGLAGLLAVLIENLRHQRFRHVFIAAFVVVNIGYLWAVKHPQYLRRAAPTTRLLEELRSRSPRCLEISGFPMNQWIAKEAALHVPGWGPEMLRVNEPPDAACDRLRWNTRLERYEPLSAKTPRP